MGEIVQMELSRQEKEHRSRNRYGFHIYLSRFFREFNVLSPIEKQEMLGINIILGEDESVDSTDSRNNKIPVGNVLSYASRIWSVELPESIKEAWRARATRLNARPVPGKFLKVPDDVNNNIILHSINAEWQVLVENLKRCIVRPPKRGNSIMTRSFGKERVKIGSQVLRSFMVSITLQTVLFGRDYNNFKEHEIIINNKKRILIHIASKQRLEAIFTTMRQCGVFLTWTT